MYTIQHNPARLYNYEATGIIIVQHKHTKILGLRGKRKDIFCSLRRSGISCDRWQLYESNWTLHSYVTCISKKISETRTDEWHTAWINQRVPSLGVDKGRDFHPAVSSFYQTDTADEISFCYLSTGYRTGAIQTQGSWSLY